MSPDIFYLFYFFLFAAASNLAANFFKWKRSFVSWRFPLSATPRSITGQPVHQIFDFFTSPLLFSFFLLGKTNLLLLPDAVLIRGNGFWCRAEKKKKNFFPFFFLFFFYDPYFFFYFFRLVRVLALQRSCDRFIDWEPFKRSVRFYNLFTAEFKAKNSQNSKM